jgi:cytochrome oxidase Cu insertion factor (SCO1/SenC/PrrC family)
MMQPSSTGASREGPVDRSAAFAAGPTRVPRRFVHLVLLATAVLGIGGALLEHVLDAAGVNPTAPSVASPAPLSHPVAQSSNVEHEAVVPGELAAFMGLTRMTPGQARPFSLLDERGQMISLADESTRVVVLTFFDGRCNDICPVVAGEIEKADADLAGLASRVSFLTVNTDPAVTAVSGLQGVLVRTGLGRLSNWHMLTGPVSELNTVWQSYGITVSYDTATREVEHNDVMYFLDGKGRFRYRATPFANESRPSGIYELPSAGIAQFASGIATYAGQLVVER